MLNGPREHRRSSSRFVIVTKTTRSVGSVQVVVFYLFFNFANFANKEYRPQYDALSEK